MINDEEIATILRISDTITMKRTGINSKKKNTYLPAVCDIFFFSLFSKYPNIYLSTSLYFYYELFLHFGGCLSFSQCKPAIIFVRVDSILMK